jgi:hypothetical protein
LRSKGEVQSKPGRGRHVALTETDEQGNVSFPKELVPNSLVSVLTPIGNKTPKMIIPTIVANLMTVIQNSISPNLLTLRTLNRKGRMKNTVIQTYRYFSSVTHVPIILSITTSCNAKLTDRASQYDQPHINPYR